MEVKSGEAEELGDGGPESRAERTYEPMRRNRISGRLRRASGGHALRGDDVFGYRFTRRISNSLNHSSSLRSFTGSPSAVTVIRPVSRNVSGSQKRSCAEPSLMMIRLPSWVR